MHFSGCSPYPINVASIKRWRCCCYSIAQGKNVTLAILVVRVLTFDFAGLLQRCNPLSSLYGRANPLSPWGNFAHPYELNGRLQRYNRLAESKFKPPKLGECSIPSQMQPSPETRVSQQEDATLICSRSIACLLISFLLIRRWRDVRKMEFCQNHCGTRNCQNALIYKLVIIDNF